MSKVVRLIPPAGMASLHVGLTTGHAIMVYRTSPVDNQEGTPMPNLALRKAALMKGCELAGTEQFVESDDLGPDQKTQLIVDAIERIVDGGDKAQLTANGLPTVEALSTAVGFTVSASERDAAFAVFEASLDDE